MPASPSWDTVNPPPKDGTPIILYGAVFVADEMGGYKDFVLELAHFDAASGHWLDQENMSIRQFPDAELQCYAWCPLPVGDPKQPPIVIEARGYGDES